MTLEQLQQSINQLYWWDGYERQAALERLNNCFEPILFPHLLRKLSDYIPINRQLASQHLLAWAKRPECADLCVEYFLDLLAIQKRIRIVDGVEELLFSRLDERLEKIEQIILDQQGELSRKLYQYLKIHKKLSDSELLSLSKYANDQFIRFDWVNDLLQKDCHFIKQQFSLVKHIDVKKQILVFLLNRNELDEIILLEALNCFHTSILDIAIFALKKRQFDFYSYFNKTQINMLSDYQRKLRTIQMILLDWNKVDFILVLRHFDDKNIIFSILIKAIKLNYLSERDIIQFLISKNIKYPYTLLRKFMPVLSVNLDQIEDFYALCIEELTIDQRLAIYSYLPFWEKLSWLSRIYMYCENKQENDQILLCLGELLKLIKYQYYAPLWSVEIKQQSRTMTQAMFKRYELEETHKIEYDKVMNFLQ